MDRNPISELALTLDDIQPGRRITRFLPEQPGGGTSTDYIVRSLPFSKPKHEHHPILAGSLWVELELDPPRNFREEPFTVELSLMDMGVTPHSSGWWHYHFTVAREDAERDWSLVQSNPRVIEARESDDRTPLWDDLVDDW